MDIPNAFVQTAVPQGKIDEKIIMKLRGALVDMLIDIRPGKYEEFIVYERNQKVLYVKMLKALYGMLKASILYYKKFRTDIESIGYLVNPVDACVANTIINGKQHTLTWHVDDVKASHVDSKVNDTFHKWCDSKYGSENLGHITVVRSDKYDYLVMNLDYLDIGKLKIDMQCYIDNIDEAFPYEIKPITTAPWNEKLFKVLESVESLVFHTYVI